MEHHVEIAARSGNGRPALGLAVELANATRPRLATSGVSTIAPNRQKNIRADAKLLTKIKREQRQLAAIQRAKASRAKMQSKARGNTPAATPRIPTLNQFETNLRRGPTTRSMTKMDPWVHCRLDPFSSTGQVAKPDGRANKFIVADHFMSDTLTALDVNGFIIQTMPGFLPYTAVAGSYSTGGAAGVSVNGVSVAQGTSNSSFFPFAVPTEWGGQASLVSGDWSPSTTPKNDPYSSSRARVISVKRRFYYTGNVQNNTGTVTVTPSTIVMSDSQSISGPGGNINVRYMLPDGTFSSSAPPFTPVRNLDGTIYANPFTRDSVRSRIDHLHQIVSKQSGTDHDMSPTNDFGVLAVFNQSLSAPSSPPTLNAFAMAGTQSAAATGPGIWHYDKSWDGELIVVTGPTVGATFVLETAMCVEYEVQTASPLVPLTRSPVPARPTALTTAHKAVNALPVSVVTGGLGPR